MSSEGNSNKGEIMENGINIECSTEIFNLFIAAISRNQFKTYMLESGVLHHIDNQDCIKVNIQNWCKYEAKSVFNDVVSTMRNIGCN